MKKLITLILPLFIWYSCKSPSQPTPKEITKFTEITEKTVYEAETYQYDSY